MDNSMRNLRILDGGQIQDLTDGFKLSSGEPFSVFLKPKTLSMDSCTTLQCKLYAGSQVISFPVPLNDWTPGAIKEIAPNAVDLTQYDLYWGAGYVSNNQ